MRVDTIEDFKNLVSNCPFCGSQTQIFFDSRNVNGFYPKNLKKYNARKSAEYLSGTANPYTYTEKARSYFTKIDGDILTLMCAVKNSQKENIGMVRAFSVDVKNNKFVGDIQKSCLFLWDNNIFLTIRCIDSNCCYNSSFVYTSKYLTIERSKSMVSPIVLDEELVSISINQKRIHMLSVCGIDNTFVIKTDISNGNNIVNLYKNNDDIISVPRVSILSLKSRKDIENKIKTILLFS